MTEEQILSSLAKIVAEEIAPRALEVDRSGRHPGESIDALRRGGFLGLTVPTRFGGLGAGPQGSFELFARAIETVAKGCGSTAQLMAVHWMNASNIVVLGTSEQQSRFFPEILEGRMTLASLSSEPTVAITHSPRLDTVARRGDGGWYVSGEKHFATGSGGFSHFLVNAQAANTSDIRSGLIRALVPRDSDGLIVRDDWNAMGQRGTGSNSVKLEDVFIPDSFVLGELGSFLESPVFVELAHLAFSAHYVGVAGGAFDAALAYVQERARPWAGLTRATDDPFIQLRFADMDIGIHAARALLYEAARLQEQAESDGALSPDAAAATYRAKVLATDVALDVTTRVFQVCGARATFRDYGMDRYWRDVRTLTLHDPVDRRREVIAKRSLGVDFARTGFS